MLDPLPSLDIEAPVATEQAEDLPVDADAEISNRESEAGDETGNVTEIDRGRPVEVDECVVRASEAQSVEGRPRRAHRRPAYCDDSRSFNINGAGHSVQAAKFRNKKD